jgi:hypothetical protein
MHTTSRRGRSRLQATPRRFAKEAFDAQMRQRRIFSVQAQADTLGVHRATLSYWASDERQAAGVDVSLADACQYAANVGLPVDRLFVPIAAPVKVAA